MAIIDTTNAQKTSLLIIDRRTLESILANPDVQGLHIEIANINGVPTHVYSGVSPAVDATGPILQTDTQGGPPPCPPWCSTTP